MSCVVGITDGKTVWMGADSAITFGDYIRTDNIPKLLKVDGVLIGMAGGARAYQILKVLFRPPKRKTRESVYGFIVRFVESMRLCLNGCRHEIQGDDDKDPYFYLFLIGYKGRLFKVDPAFSICEHILGYDAIGEDSVALGCLYTEWTHYGGLETHTPDELILRALNAVEAHCGVVRGPMIVETVK